MLQNSPETIYSKHDRHFSLQLNTWLVRKVPKAAVTLDFKHVKFPRMLQRSGMPQKGRRSQAQKLRWTKVDLTGWASISKDVAQVSDRQQSEDGDNTSRILSVQASHCQSEGTLFKQPDLDRVLEEGDALYVGIKMQLIAEGRFRWNHLSMGEVPVSITTSNHTYNIQKSEVLMGYLRARGNPEMERWWISS
ncbi:replicase helicase endonuclease [Labeo rohita]|uniref:Replicase helicase endonuclease n=1 Tax=Labeo rohita TaxID=84645 RepID=A0A498MD04_LABRO|nr:replicase helicase endonuclease [Labeo rohita]